MVGKVLQSSGPILRGMWFLGRTPNFLTHSPMLRMSIAERNVQRHFEPDPDCEWLPGAAVEALKGPGTLDLLELGVRGSREELGWRLFNIEHRRGSRTTESTVHESCRCDVCCPSKVRGDVVPDFLRKMNRAGRVSQVHVRNCTLQTVLMLATRRQVE